MNSKSFCKISKFGTKSQVAEKGSCAFNGFLTGFSYKIGRPHIFSNKIKVAKRFLEKNVEMPIIIYGLQLSEDEIKTLD